MITKGEIIAILGLANGMIGGTVLVLPVYGLKSGYILIPLISGIFGLLTAYTCYLIIQHMGTSSIRTSILEHFNNKNWTINAYDIIIVVSLFGVVINYFILILIQLQGFFDITKLNATMIYLIMLIYVCILRNFHLGENTLAFGFLTVASYIIFIFWSHFTAPSGPKTVPPTGPGFVDLSASLLLGYSVHNIVTQILIQTTTPDKYRRVITIVYIIVYGAYSKTQLDVGIVNRTPHKQQPETIQDYFSKDSFPVKVIRLIYLSHMVFAIPELLIVMKMRLFSILGIPQTSEISVKQIILFTIILGVCLISYILNIKLATIIQINGSIIGITYIIIIPIVIHVKCVYFSKHDDQGFMISQKNGEQNQRIQYYGSCKCRKQYRNRFTQLGQALLLIVIIIIGVLVCFKTMHHIFFETQQLNIHSQNASNSVDL